MTINLPHLYSGKVRDIYDAGEGLLLFVASDRMSAFDVVMAEPIPDKGRVLSGMTVHWLSELTDLCPSHLVTADPDQLPEEARGDRALAGRAMLVRKASMLPIECIVRGYVSGSAWKEYRSSGTIHGMKVATGLQESEALPEPMFTPSTKAEVGAHDENISYQDAVDLVGPDVAAQARELSLEAYRRGAERAAAHGIILADTKFELGWIDGELAICDEVLTPDSSRYWDAEEWKPGTTPPSFDKQPLRDWLEATGWDKSPPPPSLPDDVVEETRARYVAAYEKVCGKPFSSWYGVGE